jgi:hypothetical protein
MARKRRFVNTIPIRKVFLIVCEGEKTEPSYFKGFPVPQEIVDVEGLGANTISLVREAIRLRDAAAEKSKAYDQVWCVFDKDSFTNRQFMEAISLARNNNLEVAYSNESFELWYLLHFGLMQAALSRDQYIERLKHFLGDYQKNDDSMYKKLFDGQEAAIRNARQLLDFHDGLQPHESNPSTTVHLLVIELNKNARP